MNDPDVQHDLNLEMDQLEFDAKDKQKLGNLIDLTFRVKGIETRAATLRKDLDKRIKEALLDHAMTTAAGDTRKVILAERTFYGVAEGANPDELEENRGECLAFVIKHGQHEIKATTANIKKAVEAFMDDNPGVELPKFIAIHSDPVLRNLKA